MDDDPGQIDTQEPQGSDPTIGDRAADAGRGVKNAAQNAKDAIGGGQGGSGDGLNSKAAGVGSALKNAASSLGGSGSPMGGLGKSMDGMKGMGGLNKTPSMFKGMEGSNKPHDKNNPSAEKNGNPSASDFAKKAGVNAAKNSKTGQKAQQLAKDAIETAKDAKDVGRLVATGGVDATAWADLAKRFASHPIEFTKRYGRIILYAAGFFFLQFAVVAAIFGALFFGIYKVYLAGMEVIRDPTKIVTELNVNFKMAQWLSGAVLDLTYERAKEEGRKSGVVLAQEDYENYNLSAVRTNPETEKLHEAWSGAGLAATFMDDYNARIEPNGSARQVDSFDPSAWNLYVNDQDYGTLNSSRAKAFISIFTSETTHWDDIYTRANYKATAIKAFGVDSFKIDLPDSENNLEKSEQHVTQQLIDTTLKPIQDKSGDYYSCLISGVTACADLGLGSQQAPNNDPPVDNPNPGFFGKLFGSWREKRVQIMTDKLADKVDGENLGAFTQSISDDITPNASQYETKDTLDAAVRTGSSDTVLRSIGKSDEDGKTPDAEALLEMYERFQRASGNGNYARVNYDRQSRQSVALASTYFTAGGQLLNNDMGVLDSWALTKNLSVLEESPIFRAAVIGTPIGIFAQDNNDGGYDECQAVYDDQAPVGKVDTNTDRPVQESSCFRRALIPDDTEFEQEKNLKLIYKRLKEINEEYDKEGSTTGGLIDKIKRIIDQQRLKEYDTEKTIRTSPIAAEKVSLSADLGPEFDAYTNQVYGVSKTGAEVNGDAYDGMAMAAQALWTQAAFDEDYGIGGKYLTNEETAEIQRYARTMEREKLALKPLSERLLSLKTPDSLAGKLALLTPTNRGDGAKKTLALFKPANLSSAIAVHLTPTTIAQAAEPVNPLNGVSAGYPLSDPSNTMNPGQLWDFYGCDSGGVDQTKTRPDNIPFDVAATTNPCKRESVIAQVAGCFFDTEDSCSFTSQLPSTNTNATSTGIVGDIGVSSGTINGSTNGEDVPCAAGSTEVGNVESLYTGSLRKSDPLIIKLCQVESIGGRGNDASGSNIDGGVVVNSRVSGAWVALGEAAKQANPSVELAGSSFRLGDSCGGTGSGSACAKPGSSMHQLGIAVDFFDMGSKSGSTSSCSQRAGALTDGRWQWLFTNAERFGIKQYSYEPWHWDLGDFDNRCDSSSPAIGQDAGDARV